MALKLTFVGTGDAFGSGGRFNTCFHLASDTCTALIDCGASSMVAMRKQDIDIADIDIIFLTHLHGDHFGALPFFMLDANFVSVRKKPLFIVGPPGTQDRLNQAMEALFPGSSKISWHFEHQITEMSQGSRTEVLDAAVEPFEVVHPSGAPSHAVRVTMADRSVTYSGDTEWTDALLSASDGADLFICECHSYDKAVPFHLTYAILQEKIPQLTAKRLILTHMSDSMLQRCGEIDLETAYDGLVIDL